MTPRELSDKIIREVPLLSPSDPVRKAVETLLESGLPALPVVEGDEFKGIFGEREFMTALFPGYVKELRYAGFVPAALEEALEKRAACANEPVSEHMLTEHIDVSGDFSDVQVAETFLHHRVLIVPVTEDGRVVGIITRSEFFKDLAERFLDR